MCANNCVGGPGGGATTNNGDNAHLEVPIPSAERKKGKLGLILTIMRNKLPDYDEAGTAGHEARGGSRCRKQVQEPGLREKMENKMQMKMKRE